MKTRWDRSNETISLGKHYRYNHADTRAYGSHDGKYLAVSDLTALVTSYSSSYGTNWTNLLPSSVKHRSGTGTVAVNSCVMLSMSVLGDWMMMLCNGDYMFLVPIYIFTRDYGATWQQSNYITAIAEGSQFVSSSDGKIVYGLDYNNHIIASVNYGMDFVTMPRYRFYLLACDAAGRLLVGYARDTTIHGVGISHSNGQEWSFNWVTDDKRLRVTRMYAGDSGEHLGFLTNSGDLRRSENFGKAWRRVGQPCNPKLDPDSCTLAHDGERGLRLSFVSRTYGSADHGLTWEDVRGRPCDLGLFGSTCASYCAGDTGYYYHTKRKECRQCAKSKAVKSVRFQGTANAPVVEIGVGTTRCDFPYVSYFTQSGQYFSCYDKTAVSLDAPIAAVTAIIAALGVLSVGCHFLMREKGDKIEMKLVFGLLYFTILPVTQVLVNLIMLLRGTFANYALYSAAWFFWFLPLAVFFAQIQEKNARCKFYILSMPHHLVFLEYDSYDKLAWSALQALPFFLVNLPALLPLFGLGCMLFLTNAMCIRRVQKIWYRTWTGNWDWPVGPILDKAQYNQFCVAVLVLESAPWLVIQASSILLISFSQLTLVSLLFNIFLLSFGLLRYSHYVLRRRLQIVQAPMKISLPGMKTLYLVESDRQLFSRSTILPGNNDLYDAAVALEDDELPGGQGDAEDEVLGGAGGGSGLSRGLHVALRLSQKADAKKLTSQEVVFRLEHLEERLGRLEKDSGRQLGDHTALLSEHDRDFRHLRQQVDQLLGFGQ